MKIELVPGLLLCAASLLAGCATYDRHGLDPLEAQKVEKRAVVREFNLSPELQDKILALDPTHVSEKNIREVLSQAPAPRLINIHGGIYPVHMRMVSFCEFLMGMGYPGNAITNPGDGTFTFSCYESAEKITGVIAWYYELEAMRPMIIGHSQGGMQAVKVLHLLASHERLPVWNPLTWDREHRFEITDPLTGKKCPVGGGLQLSFVASMGAGGLTRALPNQWDMIGSLRDIPDSVVEFTGFYKGMDVLGGDFMGYGSANLFKPLGKAEVRNVQLPTEYSHGKTPDAKHLLKSQQIIDWINNYQPMDQPKVDVQFDSDASHILFAADVWYSIKKHWVLELQRMIRAKRAAQHAA
jgi:hypothetical protein